MVVRHLLQKYSRSFFRIEECTKKCLLLNTFTKRSGAAAEANDEPDDQIQVNVVQRYYYGILRLPCQTGLSIICLVLSILIIFGESLIFQGSSIQPLFKSCLEKMDYLAYLVLSHNRDCILAAFPLHDFINLSNFVRT